MKVINNSTVFKEDPIHFLGFEKYENDNDTKNIALYIDCIKSNDIKLDSRNINILLDLELPNRYFEFNQALESIEQETKYNYIFTICPNVCKNRNKYLKEKGINCRYIYIPFPVDHNLINFNVEKDIDYIYTGNNIYYLDWITDKDKIVIVGRENIYANISNCSYLEKLKLTARSKVAIVHQEIAVKERHLRELQKFEHRDSCLIINMQASQQKARITEAALSKCLMLVKKDNFNLIEDFYSTDCFIYFSNKEELNYLINNISSKYDEYLTKIDKAYDHALNFVTTDAIYKNIIRNLK